MNINRPIILFSWILLFACLVIVYLLAQLGYEQSFIFLNSYRIEWLDLPMQFISWCGNGGTAGFICWIVLRKKSAQIQWMGFMALLISGILSQVLKTVIFPDWHRPIFLFEGRDTVHYFPGQDFKFHSFPSGHSSTAAAMGFVLARFGVQKVWWAIVPAILTILIGYSRVYNGLHFPGDVLAGWILGFITSAAMVWLFQTKWRIQSDWFQLYFPKILIGIVFSVFIFDLFRFPWSIWN